VAVPAVQPAQDQQRLDALAACLPDPDQNPRRERHRRRAGRADGFEPSRRLLVR
jgi:hypothetical protein